ncbi:MAG: sensor histidine kinase [Prevotella sp.]|nr:sensor histidine kinase [Prevotella sp.]
MNIDGLLEKYFSGLLPTIEVFDDESIHRVYSHIVNLFKACPEIELSVLQLLSYCFYEILDNVVTHSGKNCGTVISQYVKENNAIKILVVDDGIGIQRSLSENKQYKDISEEEAIRICLQDRVTDGKGMGFGLYSTLCLIRNAGIKLEIHSGSHKLVSDGKAETIESATQWQGTILFLEIQANKEIEPNEVLLNRVNVEDEFNDSFLDTEEIDDLW